jgi:putative flippase GtrA
VLPLAWSPPDHDDPAGRELRVVRTLARRAAQQHIVRFAFVGGLCTLLYLVLFVLLRLALDAQLANLLALLISAVVNTMLNRRVTFRLKGRAAPREHLSGLLAFAVGAGITAAALALLDHEKRHPSALLEVTVLLASTVVATLIRFVLFRWWVFASALDARDQT